MLGRKCGFSYAEWILRLNYGMVSSPIKGHHSRCLDPFVVLLWLTNSLLYRKIHLQPSVGVNQSHPWWPLSMLCISCLPRKTLVPLHLLRKGTSLGRWVGSWDSGWVTWRARIGRVTTRIWRLGPETGKWERWIEVWHFWGKRRGDSTFILVVLKTGFNAWWALIQAQGWFFPLLTSYHPVWWFEKFGSSLRWR
jgi:hypothetical protein